MKTIKINDTPRPFLVGIGSMMEFEKTTGKNFIAVSQSLSITDIVALAYSAFVVGHKRQNKQVDFTIDDVAEWLELPGKWEEVNAEITEGLGKAMGSEEEKASA